MREFSVVFVGCTIIRVVAEDREDAIRKALARKSVLPDCGHDSHEVTAVRC